MREKKGSYFLGIIGAILGTIVAMVPFIIIYKLGYIVFWLAFLFVALASGGYDMLKGRKGILKLPIVIIIGFIGVVFAVFSEDLYYIYSENILEANGYSFFEAPAFIMEVMKLDSEYADGVIYNLSLSLIAYVVGVVLYIVSYFKERRAEKNEEYQEQAEMYGQTGAGMQGAANPVGQMNGQTGMQPNNSFGNSMNNQANNQMNMQPNNSMNSQANFGSNSSFRPQNEYARTTFGTGEMTSADSYEEAENNNLPDENYYYEEEVQRPEE